MKRLIGALALVSLACAWVPLVTAPVGLPTATPTPEGLQATEPAAFTPAPTSTPRPAPTFTVTPQPTPSPTPEPDPQLRAEDVQLLPWPLFEGDRMTVDVDPLLPSSMIWTDDADAAPAVVMTLPDGETFSAPVGLMGLDHTAQARFYWITELPTDLATAATISLPITLTLELPDDVPDADPANNTLVIPVPILSREAVSPPEPAAQWAVTDTAGFTMHYLTGSAAERDLEAIIATADDAYLEVTARLGEPDDPVDIYLLDRVVGQGGYASSEWVAVSYPDRRYAPVSLSTVFRHELTHRLDDAIGCDGAPALLREGLAVFLAGGHYRPEPLREKAAALFMTTTYVPLATLVEDFYTHQHEVGYLEAGAMVSYLVENYGWSSLERMCRTASDVIGDDVARWDAAVAVLDPRDTGIAPDTADAVASEDGAATFEQAWQTWLKAAGVRPQDRTLVELELQLMDLMRSYQSAYDPAAHFLEGVLFSPAEGERMGIVADFVRRPRTPEAIAIELVLAMAQEAVEQRDAELLNMLNAELVAALAAGPRGSGLVADVLAITERAQSGGWEPYRLLLEGKGRFRVYVLSRQVWPLQSVLSARLRDGVWELVGTAWSD
ncbi:MAG: hypothetical protein J7M39_02220 [Anaerolineae bacterium]|nr:hypothetical protein [Anaerolineae bacterium]